MKKILTTIGILMILLGLTGIFFVQKGGIVGNIIETNQEVDESDLQQEETDFQNHESITIKEIKYQDKKIEINYFFDNSKFIGEEISVEIWILDEQDSEVKRYTDTFPIRKDNLIERNLILTIPKSKAGFYDVYLALSNNQDNYIKQKIIVGTSKTTGKTILNTSKSKLISYAIFLIVIGAGIFMIIRNRSKKIHTTREALGKKPL